MNAPYSEPAADSETVIYDVRIDDDDNPGVTLTGW